jgi:hypothetical protein
MARLTASGVWIIARSICSTNTLEVIDRVVPAAVGAALTSLGPGTDHRVVGPPLAVQGGRHCIRWLRPESMRASLTVRTHVFQEIVV